MTSDLGLRALPVLSVGVILLCLVTGRSAAAQNVSVQARGLAPLTGQQAQDEEVVDRALVAIKTGGPAAVEAMIPSLKAVLSHAPKTFPIIERDGDTITIRADTDKEYLMLSMVVGTEAVKGQSKPTPVKVVRGSNTYPMAALELGTYFDHLNKPEEGMRFLNDGLSIQPNSPLLIFERGASLFGQRRFAEAVALCDAALASDDFALIDSRARLLRNRGIALTRLGRLDEAEKSLRESIEADKSDARGIAHANKELMDIKHLRSGEAPPEDIGQALEPRNDKDEATADQPH